VKDHVCDSVFLSGASLPTERDFRSVLILGGDSVGDELAHRLAREGVRVLLLDDSRTAGENAGVSVLSAAMLEVHGFIGNFEVALLTPEGRKTERVGFIVAAQPAELLPKYATYGVSHSEKVISLSELESRIASGNQPARSGEWAHQVFLCGLEGGSDQAQFARVLNAIEAAQEWGKVQPYVFTRQVNVAATGLERRYRECREAGTLFFKFDGESPFFEETPDGPLIRFQEPLLGLDMELVPDILVVDEFALPQSIIPLVDAIPSAAGASPFLQHESVRFSGVETAKAGILAVGPSRGVFSAEMVQTDIEAAVVAIREAASGSVFAAELGPPEVDPKKCTLCLTCARLCPHGAVTFRKSAEIDPLSCARCGICAVECPMRAISPAPPLAEQGLPGSIRRELSSAAGSSKIVAFLCSRSAAPAMAAAAAQLGENLVPFVVPCAGAIDQAHVLEAFQAGADAVLVAGCFSGNCASVYGTVLARERVAQIRSMIEESGFPPDRLRFVPVASNTPDRLIAAIREVEMFL
jgi:quinone-modifying oxidoreductase, subunit QmoB